MGHGNRKSIYAGLAVGALVLALAFGINPAFLLILAICPLMMIFMMGAMGAVENHRGHGCEHDPTRHDDRAESRS